ncbi:MAG: hypothetical protein AAFR52_01565 [Pseudomonadota bacterium]
MPYSDWMSAYQGRALADMHMPGAHDAGTIRDKVELTAMGSVSNSVTQDLSIRDQLRCGTRFFDLRLKVKDEQVVAHHTTGGQGAYGTKSFDQTIAEVDRWCGRHPTEVVIIRISHTSSDTNVATIIKDSATSNLHTGTGNLCTKTLGEIVAAGGGLICILEQKEFGRLIDQKNGIHAFSKFKDGGANDKGIASCGIYEGTHKLEKVVTNGLKGSYEHNSKHNPGAKDHLWQIYWQKTYKNPWSSTGISQGTKKIATIKNGTVHGGTHAATAHMIKLMNGHQIRSGAHFEDEDYEVGKDGKNKVMWSTTDFRNFMLPNIISYDFVNETTNKLIIDLNTRQRQQHQDVEEEEEALI